VRRPAAWGRRCLRAGRWRRGRGWGRGGRGSGESGQVREVGGGESVGTAVGLGPGPGRTEQGSECACSPAWCPSRWCSLGSVANARARGVSRGSLVAVCGWGAGELSRRGDRVVAGGGALAGVRCRAGCVRQSASASGQRWANTQAPGSAAHAGAAPRRPCGASGWTADALATVFPRSVGRPSQRVSRPAAIVTRPALAARGRRRAPWTPPATRSCACIDELRARIASAIVVISTTELTGRDRRTVSRCCAGPAGRTRADRRRAERPLHPYTALTTAPLPDDGGGVSRRGRAAATRTARPRTPRRGQPNPVLRVRPPLPAGGRRLPYAARPGTAPRRAHHRCHHPIAAAG